MFGNLGIGEILLIAAVALILLGPEKFPEYAKIALRAYRDFRGYFDDIKKEMRDELRPVQREIETMARYEPEKYIDKLAAAVTGATDSPAETASETPTANTAAESPKADDAAADTTWTADASMYAADGAGAAPVTETAAPAVDTAVPSEEPVRLDG